MIAARIRTTLPFGLLLLTALLSACASTGPPRYWTEFPASNSNFRRYFDRRGEDLDPIEGIWSPQPTEERLSGSFGLGDFAIVRDSPFENYEYIGVRFSEASDVLIIVSGVGGDTVAGAYADSLIIKRSRAPYRGAIFMALRRVEGTSGVYEYADAAVLRGEKCLDEPCHGTYVITAEGILLRQRFAIDVYQPEPGWVRTYPPP